jgi:hypothetical protein
MSESERLLSHYIDDVLAPDELEKLRARMKQDPDFAKRAGAYEEEDVLVREALRSLRHEDKELVARICAQLPEKPEYSSIAPLGWFAAFLAAAGFTTITVVLQGTANLLVAMGWGTPPGPDAGWSTLVPLLGHVLSVVVGFLTMVYTARQLFRTGFPVVDTLLQAASQPALRLFIQFASAILFMAPFLYILWSAMDSAFIMGDDMFALPIGAHVTVLTSLPLLLTLLVEAAGTAEEQSDPHAGLSLAHWAALLMLVVAFALQYLVLG